MNKLDRDYGDEIFVAVVLSWKWRITHIFVSSRTFLSKFFIISAYTQEHISNAAHTSNSVHVHFIHLMQNSLEGIFDLYFRLCLRGPFNGINYSIEING